MKPITTKPEKRTHCSKYSLATSVPAAKKAAIGSSRLAPPDIQVLTETVSGIPVKACYGPEDLPSRNDQADLGNSGEFPYTRGIHPSMYRTKLWTFRQLSGFGTAQASNRRFKYLLSQGATALSVCFDIVTKMGRDSDEEICENEVGQGGVAVDSLADMETLFDGIPLDKISVNLVSNAQSTVLMAFFLAVAEKQGIPFEQLRGTTQNDMLKEFIAEKSYIFPPKEALRLATDLVAYTVRHVPQWNPISICGYHIRSAGADAVQEVAFCLADAMAYVDSLLARGLQVDEFAPRLSFFFKAHNDLFEEVAKFRAARRLWARIMKEKYQARNPRSCMLRFHTQTCGTCLTTQQPENNIIRATVQALAAILGGTQSLHIDAYDEALSLPSEKAARVAIRTHQILACESGVAATVDPLGGSYYVESLTNEIERRVLEYLTKIADLGGALGALETGYFQREIAQSALQHFADIEDHKRIVVGVNEFVTPNEIEPAIFSVDMLEEQNQKQRLQQLRRRRDQAKVRDCLVRLQEGARGEGNLMPLILEASRAYATMGEITSALANVFGRYEERPCFQ
jgi:methylmalonyl-CoA mutase, N-terminal domain